MAACHDSDRDRQKPAGGERSSVPRLDLQQRRICPNLGRATDTVESCNIDIGIKVEYFAVAFRAVWLKCRADEALFVLTHGHGELTVPRR